MDVVIYAAGEIHSEWRMELRRQLQSAGVGKQPDARYRDLMGAQANTLRTRVLMQRADLVVAYFGPKYKQWNTASDAGFALASGLPLVLVRAEEHVHALKELDALATMTVETLEQAAQAIAYIFE